MSQQADLEKYINSSDPTIKSVAVEVNSLINQAKNSSMPMTAEQAQNLISDVIKIQTVDNLANNTSNQIEVNKALKDIQTIASFVLGFKK